METDVTALDSVKALVDAAVGEFGSVDVMVNNAGIMPLAFFADHAQAADAWSRCIDINIKGVLNGMIAVNDQMIGQGRGHVVNLSSIYGNHPVAGAGVYGATKAAVNVLSEAFRVESQGKIKVTIVKPTGVPATGIGGAVVNPGAVVGILGQNMADYFPVMLGQMSDEQQDQDNVQYAVLPPEDLVDQILYAIDQPWGVSIGDITVRATGDRYVI
jgi:NADP-dependent 3-hydroxy acid dehydrogenase YdfG